MPQVKSETVYSAVCANKHEGNIKCSKNFLLYSTCNTPVVYDIENKQVASFLVGHSDEVNGQSFISSHPEKPGSPEYIISTSYDKSAIIWRITKNPQAYETESQLLYRLVTDNKEFYTTRCSTMNNDRFLSITTTLDGMILYWQNNTLVDKVEARYSCFDSSIYTTTNGFRFVFLAGSDNNVHVFQLRSSTLEHLFDLTGHSDWIKCIDVLELADRNLEFMLASASQDSFIRIWHFKLVDYKISSTQIRTIVSKKLSENEGDFGVEYILTATLETVLSGHEGIVHSLCWFRNQPKPTIQLVSCSADKTIVVWKSSVTLVSVEDQKEPQKLNKYEQCPATSEIWKETHRMGETGETNLPFLSVCVSKDEDIIYAHSLHGAIHSWKFVNNNWNSEHTITGHFGPVTDLAWEKSGAYLLSASLDKTCRLHAIASLDCRWSELARPQVHGHELNCVASLDFTRFATGAEEKTIRIFEATQFFIRNFEVLARIGLPKDLETEIINQLPMHAQLPALGLSIRGAKSPYDIGDLGDKNGSANNWYDISKLVEGLAHIDHLEKIPTEEILLQSTLWWETNKSYGHGNELYALASDSLGSYMTSASKANRSDLANILVWDCSKFRKVASIEHHTLTITRLRFSPNDKYLLSVSRDRTWCISEKTGQLRQAYKKLFGTSKSNAVHERIIWDCCWTYNSKFFMTVSRDKKAILWSLEDLLTSNLSDQQLNPLTSKTFECSIQAVDSPDCKNYTDSAPVCTFLFALGFENGSLELYSVFANNFNNDNSQQWQLLRSFTNFHQLPIRRLAFQPTQDSRHDDALLLASAGDDCVVKLTKLSSFS